MILFLESLIMLGVVIGGVMGTGYLGVLFLAKVDEMDNEKKSVRSLTGA